MIFSNDSYYWSEFSQIIQKMNARWTISFISQANTSKLYDVGLPHLCFLFSRFFKHVERYDSGFYSPGTVSPAWCSYLSLPAGISARQIERSKSGTKKNLWSPCPRNIPIQRRCHRSTWDLGQDRNSIWKRNSCWPGQSSVRGFYEPLGDIKFYEFADRTNSLAHSQLMLSILAGS